MNKPDTLGQFEQVILTAVASLEDAYGVTILKKVEELGGKPVKFGSVYTTLDRLEEKGYLFSWMSEPTAERGGRSKRYNAWSLLKLTRLTKLILTAGVRRPSGCRTVSC